MTATFHKRQSQVIHRTKQYVEDRELYRAKVNIRHDDSCGNGYNTFAITCAVYRKTGNNRWVEDSFGCQHELVAKLWPDLAPYIKWHLVSTKGPIHYIANTMYHANNGKLEYARISAVWPNATLEQLQNKQALKARLPALIAEFKKAVEDLGLIY